MGLRQSTIAASPGVAMQRRSSPFATPTFHWDVNMRAAVIGAGLSGLTAAYRLKRAGWEVVVYEAEDEVGGRTKTKRVSGYRYEAGATVIARTYDAYFELADELGITTTQAPTIVGTYRDGRVHTMDLAHMVRSALTTRVLSLGAKIKAARILLDIVPAVRKGYLDYSDLSKAAPIDNESAGDYLRRRLGDEVFAYFGDPLTRSMMMADSDEVSKVEFFSAIMNIFNSQALTTDGGQGHMPQVLAQHVPVELGHRVERVVETPDGAEVDGEKFDAAVVTCPLPVAHAICPGHEALLGPLHETLTYTECLHVTVGTTVVPECPAWLVSLSSRDFENVALIVQEHRKGLGRAPEGHGCFDVTWEADASVLHKDASDEVLGKESMRVLTTVFPELEGSMDYLDVVRWTYALPRTEIGAYKRIADFNAALDPTSRVQFASDYMSAAGQHTAIRFGTLAAKNLIANT